MLGALLAGIPAGFVNCPACAGIVIAVAAAAAAVGNPLYSTLVMFAFGFGHAVTLVAFAWLLTRRWYPSESLLRRLRPAMAALLFAGGAYFLWFASQWGLDTGPRLAYLGF